MLYTGGHGWRTEFATVRCPCCQCLNRYFWAAYWMSYPYVFSVLPPYQLYLMARFGAIPFSRSRIVQGTHINSPPLHHQPSLLAMVGALRRILVDLTATLAGANLSEQVGSLKEESPRRDSWGVSKRGNAGRSQTYRVLDCQR